MPTKKPNLPPTSYNQLMGSPMRVDDHPVNNVRDPHGNNGITSGPSYVPGNMNPSTPKFY